jgi:hypothetical protein
MTASSLRGAGPVAAGDDLSIDDLDRAITKLARQMNAETYRMLVLVRTFDERYGWAKWGCASCAEWLAWRCGLSVSAAREKVRTANALRRLSAISAAFADGRLSYTKVRALTRVAATHDEDLLLAYALNATAADVEERCRQIRNTAPDSTEGARQVWERRSLTIFRDSARNRVRIVMEVPAQDGELVGHAIDRAVAAGEAAVGAALRRALWSRDRGCVFPGCRRTHYVDAHHLRHWARGGETTLPNTTLLCTYHHTLVHEGGFTMERDGQRICFRRPDGRAIPRNGYRAEDMIDDGLGAEGADLDRASAEQRMAAIVRGVAPEDLGDDPSCEGWMHGSGAGHPSSEVREPSAVYRVA